MLLRPQCRKAGRRSGMVSSPLSAVKVEMLIRPLSEQYKEWFYVNLSTRASQWERPTEPVYLSNTPSRPANNPTPSPDHVTKPNAQQQPAYLASNNPYNAAPGAPIQQGTYDRPSPAPPSSDFQTHSQQNQRHHGGLLGKIMDKVTGSGGASHGSGHGASGMSNKLPLSALAGSRPGAHGGHMPGAIPYGAYGHGGYGRPRPGMGMGLPVGAAALGMGGGLVGGAMLANAMHDNDYGYGNGYDSDVSSSPLVRLHHTRRMLTRACPFQGNACGGDDYGGGDYGGGDDFGGGDFGGGDFGGGDFGG